MRKKRNTAVFIDGENIAAAKAKKIFKLVKEKGVTDYIKVYGIQNDMGTRNWSKVASQTENMKDIRLCGGPAKNKVDKKIMKDTLRAVKETPNVDIFFIVSSDHGYASNVRELRAKGKHVVVLGDEKTPQSLRNAGNEFVLI